MALDSSSESCLMFLTNVYKGNWPHTLVAMFFQRSNTFYTFL